MKNLSIQFSATIQTNFGEHAVICGNIQQLGNWNPSQGLKLFTDQKTYPKWNSLKFVQVRQNAKIQFKICIINTQGNLVRWENLPFNENRTVIVGTHIAIFFFESSPLLQIIAIDPTPRINNVRKKTLDILNDLGSGSSSSQQYWRQIQQIDNNENNFAHYQSFLQYLKNSIECQNEGQIQLNPNVYENTLRDSTPTQMIAKMSHYNFCLVLNDQQNSDQQLEFSSRTSTRQQLKNCSSSNQQLGNIQKISSQQLSTKKRSFTSLKTSKNKIKCKKSNYQKIKNQIETNCQKHKKIPVIHLYIKSQNQIEQAKKIIQLNQFWKTIVHFQDSHVEKSFDFIKMGVNMIIVKNQISLKNLLTSLSQKGLVPKMVKPLLFSISVKQYFQTLIYCSNYQQKENFKNNLQNPQNEYIKKINNYLSLIPTFPQQSTLITKILFRKPSIFSEIKNGKISIVVSSQNFKAISQRVLNFLIKISEKPRYQVYILHEGKINDFKNALPTNWRNKILVMNSAGQLYASLQRFSHVFDALKLKKSKLDQMYSSIIEQISGDKHCTYDKTQNNTLLIKFTNDQFGKHIKTLIYSLVSKINKKSTLKLVIMEFLQENQIEIKSYYTSHSFYLKTIINSLNNNHILGKNLLLAVDYSSKQNILKFIDNSIKQDQNSYNILNYGFICRSQNDPQTGYNRPSITQNSFVNILQKLLDEVQGVHDKDARAEDSYSWIQTPDNTNFRYTSIKRYCSSLQPCEE